MNDKIIDFFKKEPPVYEKSSKVFWDDEHISKGMLEAHLDAAFDGASRKLPTIQKSVAWICNYCQDVENKQLLDLEKQGFETVDMFDDICGRPFTGQKESICGVFTKPVGKGNYIQLFPAFPVFA